MACESVICRNADTIGRVLCGVRCVESEKERKKKARELKSYKTETKEFELDRRAESFVEVTNSFVVLFFHFMS